MRTFDVQSSIYGPCADENPFAQPAVATASAEAAV